MPDQLSSNSELKDLTKLSERFSVQPVQDFVKLFDPDLLDDDDDDDTCNGGFVTGLDNQMLQEVIIVN